MSQSDHQAVADETVELFQDVGSRSPGAIVEIERDAKLGQAYATYAATARER